MVVIRLARFGAKNSPRYRVTVADQRRALRGKFLEVIGHYNPVPEGKEVGLVVDVPKAMEWIKKGAQPTPTVKTLLKKAGASFPETPRKAAPRPKAQKTQ